MIRRVVADGIELRLLEPGDADTLFAVVDRNREYLRRWLAWVDLTHSADDIRLFISKATAELEDGFRLNFGIWLDEKLAGAIGCPPIDPQHRNCSLGYWIEASHQRKGIVTRCCRHLLDYLFDEVGLHRVEIRCGSVNIRSCAIPERLGFSLEGVLRESEFVDDRWLDLQVWSMLEQDWREIR